MGMSRRAYARYRGCSEGAVRKSLSTGRIRLGADGTLDPLDADAQWAANTYPARSQSRPKTVNPSHHASLGDGPLRLAKAAALVPQFIPWIPLINWLASPLFDVLKEHEEEQMPAMNARDMHLILRSLLRDHLLETGAIDAPQDLLVDPVL